jgi:hypothetical protein
MRFVPIKTDDKLDLQAPHRVRNRLIARRTSVINRTWSNPNFTGVWTKRCEESAWPHFPLERQDPFADSPNRVV